MASASPSAEREGGDEEGAWQIRLKGAAIIGGLALFALLLSLPPPSGMPLEAWRVVPVAALMALWWITEAIPVPATALLPIAAFPTLGVLPASEATAPYASSVIFLFMGGFILGLAMERWQLHRRVALTILSKTGSRQDRIVGGFMLATAFLSMWVSNTATAVMMLPITLSVIGLLSPDASTADGVAPLKRGLPLALLLGVAYSASIGGLATLIGTPPNALLAGTLSQTYGYDLGFARWMLIGLPVSLVMLVFAWLVLTRFAIRLGNKEAEGAAEIIQRELRGLGAMSWQEKIVGIVFLSAALAWMTRQPLQSLIPGLNDASIAIIAALALFLLPSGDPRNGGLMNWEWAKRLPWGVLLLFGGGLSLAEAVGTTGLDEWIGTTMGDLTSALPVLLIVLLTCIAVICLTEFTSNTATAATFLPIVAALSISLGENPLILMVPAALAASCAFMMPVATPPNAIVFGSGHITIPRMAGTGVWLDLLGLATVTGLGYLAMTAFFGVTRGQLPGWAG